MTNRTAVETALTMAVRRQAVEMAAPNVGVGYRSTGRCFRKNLRLWRAGRCVQKNRNLCTGIDQVLNVPVRVGDVEQT